MIYKSLHNGDPMPAIGLGTWKSSTQSVYDAVFHALKNGYQHVDCAPIYMNEKPVGKAISDALAHHHVSREQLWVTSKLWNSYHAPEDVMPALKQTLHFMQLDYLDAYLIHWPVACKRQCQYGHVTTSSDYIALSDLPLHTTWEAMIECQKAGLSRHIGVSNCSISKIEDLIDKTNTTPSINQIEYHPYLNQQALRDYCQEKRICLTAYSPLGSNDRPPQLKAPNEPPLLTNDTVVDIAHQQNASAAQVLIAWSLAQGNAVIPKSTHPDRIDQNLASLHLDLSAEQLTQLSNLNLDYRFVKGVFFEIPGSPYTVKELWS